MNRPACSSRLSPRTATCTCAAALALLMLALTVSGCSGPSRRPPANFNTPSSSEGEDARPTATPADRRAVRAVLRRQRRAWNRGDLEGYMRGYARTDTLRFAAGAQERTGWEETLARYRRSYPDAQAMGTLSFSEVDVDLLSGRHALVFGRWDLAYDEEASRTSAGGLFTLLFEKTASADGSPWRIVHDHTSSGD
jgi:ketosteroid isomerase-like protein